MLDLLDAMGVRHVIDHRLVRGLDYYTRTTFEFFVAGREGQQDAVGGGGRYDGLAELLGGRATPGIGFGIGLDRTVLALEAQGVEVPSGPPLVAVLGTGEDHADRLRVAGELRAAGLSVRADTSDRKLGKQLEAAIEGRSPLGGDRGRGARPRRGRPEGPRKQRAADDRPFGGGYGHRRMSPGDRLRFQLP